MEDVLFTVKETAKLLKTNTNYVYSLIRKNYLKCLKLGSIKIRKAEITRFVDWAEGKDLTDLDNIKGLDLEVKEDEKEA